MGGRGTARARRWVAGARIGDGVVQVAATGGGCRERNIFRALGHRDPSPPIAANPVLLLLESRLASSLNPALLLLESRLASCLNPACILTCMSRPFLCLISVRSCPWAAAAAADCGQRHWTLAESGLPYVAPARKIAEEGTWTEQTSRLSRCI